MKKYVIIIFVVLIILFLIIPTDLSVNCSFGINNKSSNVNNQTNLIKR